MTVVDDVRSQFTKRELMTIASELNVGAQSTDNSADIIGKLIKAGKLLAADSSQDTDVSDLALAFLVTAEVIDEEGNMVKEDESLEKPECYGYEDDRDPSCVKCSVQASCRALRISRRPKCFGKYFDVNAPECGSCLENRFCKLV